MSTELPQIVRRALLETVCDIGQLSKSEVYQLNKYVKRGWLSRGKGGPFPKSKTIYACPGFDFEASRERYVEELTQLIKLDKAAGHGWLAVSDIERTQPKEQRQ